MTRLLLGLFLALPACGGCRTDSGRASDGQVDSSRAPDAESADAAPDEGADAAAGATDADKKKLETYRAAITRGRQLTTSKDYPNAIKAFDEALVAMPNDPRALAERGYAKLLSKDFDGADTDLVKASRGTDDTALRAQIEFNVGLVAERSGDRGVALLHYWRSNDLNPSAAAQAKLAGKNVCPVERDLRIVSGTVVPSWLDAYDLLWTGQACFLAPTPRPSSEADAKAALVVGSPLSLGRGDDAYVATAGVRACGLTYAVVQVTGTKLYVYPDLASTYPFPQCTNQADLGLESLGSYLHVKIKSELSWWTLFCGHADSSMGLVGALASCSAPDAGEPFTYGCDPQDPQFVDVFIDPQAHAKEVRVTDDVSPSRMTDGGARPIQFGLDGTTIKLEGLGCKERLP